MGVAAGLHEAQHLGVAHRPAGDAEARELHRLGRQLVVKGEGVPAGADAVVPLGD